MVTGLPASRFTRLGTGTCTRAFFAIIRDIGRAQLTGYDLGQRRKVWRGTESAQQFHDREAAASERREQIREDYRAQLGTDCVHGPRKKVVGCSNGEYWGGLACSRDSANCGIRFLSPAQIYAEWRDGQPDNPAGA